MLISDTAATVRVKRAAMLCIFAPPKAHLFLYKRIILIIKLSEHRRGEKFFYEIFVSSIITLTVLISEAFIVIRRTEEFSIRGKNIHSDPSNKRV